MDDCRIGYITKNKLEEEYIYLISVKCQPYNRQFPIVDYVCGL
jgi:hypothetical protein